MTGACQVSSDPPTIECPGHDAPAQAVVSPEGRLVFESDSTGPCIGVYSSNPDGSDLRRLTHAVNGYFETGPRWSPDGRRIAFVGECGQPRSDLCVMDADGTAQTTVVARLNNAAPPTWSPDGTRLAFARTGPSDAHGVTPESEIHVIRTDGTGETTVVKDGHAPSWSPDGTRIAFVRGRDTVAKIYVVNPDGTGLVRLTEGPFDEMPAWSPDGARIVFTSGRAGKPEFMTDYARQVLRSGKESILTDPNRPVRPANDVYVMGADGAGITRLTSDPSDNVEPAWSPDGARIVSSSSRDGDYDLYVMQADGTDQVQVTDIPQGETNASWAGLT
jgi:Tol biopolymer transport system component